MSGGDFLDSNVILYSMADVDARKRDIAADIIDASVRDGSGWISFQVVQEVLNTLTSPAHARATAIDVDAILSRVLVRLWRVMPTQALYERALVMQRRYKYSFYDSLIVAAALSSGCDRLLTEDLQHGQRIEGLVIHNPFA